MQTEFTDRAVIFEAGIVDVGESPYCGSVDRRMRATALMRETVVGVLAFRETSAEVSAERIVYAQNPPPNAPISRVVR